MTQTKMTAQKVATKRNGARIGLVEIYNGPGKGKTTAALGLAVRATGHGLKAIVIGFAKRDFEYGEEFFASNYRPFEMLQLNGKNGAWQSRDQLYAAIREAFNDAEKVLLKGGHDVVILDDIFAAVDAGLLNVEHVMHLIRIRPP